MSEHPDLSLHEEFEGTFSRILEVPAHSELHFNVGRHCVGMQSEFLANNELMTVTAVQRLYDGTLGYRLSRGPGDFGRPARPEEVCWLTADEPVVTLFYRSEHSDDPEQLRVPVSRQSEAEDCLARLGWPLLSAQVDK